MVHMVAFGLTFGIIGIIVVVVMFVNAFRGKQGEQFFDVIERVEEKGKDGEIIVAELRQYWEVADIHGGFVNKGKPKCVVMTKPNETTREILRQRAEREHKTLLREAIATWEGRE